MRNKLLALILVCCMLLSTIPGAVTAASQSPTQSNLDEILDNYHQKAIEARYHQTASSNTRSIENEKSLEEETVDLLIDAGYEAYHVTPDNYDNLGNL